MGFCCVTFLAHMEGLRLADWCQALEPSVLREMIDVVSKEPLVINFATGLPESDFFPAKEYKDAISLALASDPLSLQYRPPYEPLKKHIVEIMAKRGVHCTPEQVFITTGAQQGLNVLTRMLLNPGGDMILEEVVYAGLRQAINPLQPKIHFVNTDLATGMDIGELEALLEKGVRPPFFYIVPNAQAPIGVSLSPEKRKQILALASKWRIPVIEDDTYGFLTYNGEEQCLKSLNDDWVFYLGSFSKVIAPALRLGWMVAPPTLLNTLTVLKEATDLESSGLTQRAVSAYLDQGHFWDQVGLLNKEYQRRRDVMLECLTEYFSDFATWSSPTGGLFIWVVLTNDVDTRGLLDYCLKEVRVAFIPGCTFALPGAESKNTMRLNFASSKPSKIREGIRLLGGAVLEYQKKQSKNSAQ